MSEERKLFIPTNGIDATTGGYLLPPLTVEQLAHIARDEKLDRRSGHFHALEIKAKAKKFRPGPMVEKLDADNLSQVGWGVIFARADEQAAAIRAALQPLLKYRRKQAMHYYREFTEADAYQSSESKQSFLRRHGVGFGPFDPSCGMPYYLLIVGSPELIPYRFQYELDVQFAVGRIHFDTLAEYEHYARSVVAAETGQVLLPRTATFFGVHNPNDMATMLSADHLVSPLASTMHERFPGWNIQTILKDDATKKRLSSILGGDKTPAFFFSASHGVGFPSGHPQQIPHQGALLCQDWPGPKWRNPIPQDFYFAGDDLERSANLLGTIAFFFACFGAGTPKLDDFSRQSFSGRGNIAPHAFLARLPQRMLGHPRGGALAVVGHVERAWGYSLLETNQKKKQQQLHVFESTLLRLMDRHRLGYAFDLFNGRYAETSVHLNEVLDNMPFHPVDPEELAALWTTNHDVRNYIVIGDPAVRLPVGSESNHETRRPDIGRVNIPSIDTSKLTERIARVVSPTAETRPGITNRISSPASSPPPDPPDPTSSIETSPPTTPLLGKQASAAPGESNQPTSSANQEPPTPPATPPSSSSPPSSPSPPPPPSSPAPTADDLQSGQRKITVWVEGVAKDEPLALSTTCELKFCVDISTDEARAHAGGVSGLLRNLQNDEHYTEVLVVLDTDDVTIYGETQQTLVVPQDGASKNTITFCIEPQQLGSATISALCFANGRLCQKLTITLQVGEGNTKTASASVQVETSGMTLDSGIARALRSTGTTPTITLALRKKPDDSYQCILYAPIQRQGSAQASRVLRARLPLDDTQLADLVARARDDLHFITLFRLDGESVYQQDYTTIPPEVHTATLRMLASLGYHLYRQLFYAPGSSTDARAVGDLLSQLSRQQQLNIEIAADTFVVPWDMLYDRDPAATNRVDPEGFWGFRHIVQQMPEFRSPSPVNFVPEMNDPSSDELAVSFAYNSALEQDVGHTVVQDQRSLLQNLPTVRLDEHAGRDDLYNLLTADMGKAHVISCYCRARSYSGKQQTVAASALILADGEIALDEVIRAPVEQQAAPANAPFVLLNICQSEGFTPYMYNELLPHLLGRGARGAMGTVFDVPAPFAAEFACDFLRRFLSGGQPAGKLLRGLRREYLEQNKNALGLLYTLYSSGEVVVQGAQETQGARPSAVATPFTLGGIPESDAPPPPAPPKPPETLGGVSFGLFGSGGSNEGEQSTIEQTRDYLGGAIQEFANRLGETLKKSISEVTTMEVSTYVSDEVESTLEDASLRAFTRVHFDGDTEACVPRHEGEIDAELWQMHLDMVERAQVHRAELLKTLAEAASGLFDVLKLK